MSRRIIRPLVGFLTALVALTSLSLVSAQPAAAAVTRQLTTATCQISKWPLPSETKTYKLEYERISSNGQVRVVAVGSSGGNNTGNKIFTSNQGSWQFTNLGSMHEVSGTSFVNSFTWYGTGGGCQTTTRTVT